MPPVRNSVHSLLCLGAVLLLVPQAALAQEDSEEVLLSYLHVWNSGQLEALDELLAPGFQRQVPGEPTVDDIDVLKQQIVNSRALWRDLQIKVEDLIISGDRAAVQCTFSGQYRDTQYGTNFPIIAIYRFADGKLVEELLLRDNFAALVGLGYGLAPPGYEIELPSEGDSGTVAQ